MNLAPYMHLRDGNDMEPMDERHVRMIHSVLVTECPTSVVNIGIANGFSSVATIQAVLDDYVDRGIFVDLNLRECFKKLLPPANLPFLQTHEMDSKDYNGNAECWIIDGEHKKGAVVDYENARRSNARIIIAHDTAPDWAPACQWGAIEIGKRMRESAVCWFEDWADRKGELTKRGLTVAFYYQPKQETMDRLAAIARSA